MAQPILVELQVPEELEGFRFPSALDQRLQTLLSKQDAGQPLSSLERAEAEALVALAETLSLLRLRAESAARST